jgi:catechol 2,3-dioxygenase-like lactoylglutathione lyase family enzyme
VLGARYVHTNLVARDWRLLERFYVEVFGCERVPPERDYSGDALEAGTGIPGAKLTGVHLRLPGHGPQGPTLEIFHYEPEDRGPAYAVNRPGWGHIAFEVDHVETARDAVLARGGTAVGEVVELRTGDGRRVTWCYVTDPEGNVLEIQSWD